jgi:oligopeptidase B
MQAHLAPPTAPPISHVTEVHGEKIVDSYAWLRDRENPAVLEFLRQENQYTAAMMADTEALRDELFEEMKSRMPEADVSAPVPDGPYVYYLRTEAGKNYGIHCRSAINREGLPGSEEILLDENLLADGQEYLELGAFVLSDDQQLLAYSVDFAGGEKFQLRVRNLANETELPDVIENTYYSVEWSACGRYLFYTTLDEAMRPYRLWRHRLGTATSEDVLLYEETDQAFHIEVGKTRSKRFLLLESASLTTSETWLLDATTPEAHFRPILPRRHKIEYTVEHQGRHLWFTINDRGRNFRLVRVPLEAEWAREETWEEVIAHRPEVCLEGLGGFEKFLVISERDRGLPQILILNTETSEQHRVHFPEAVYTASVGANAEYSTKTLRISYASPACPPMSVDYGMLTRSWTVVKQKEVFGDFKPQDYVVERLHASASDGEQIPISVVYRRDLPRDGSAPALLYGYGAYGLTSEPGFSGDRLSLLERGFVYAIAHVRGGGDLGETWHDAGKMENKPKTFSDFISCAELLISQGYTSPKKLGIVGRSAGGLLIGAVVNQRPDLFGAAIASVPFVDVLNTMLDATLPLTVGEYEEWGNPQDPRYFEIIRSYSPYDNIRRQDYPHMLVTGGLNDPRVSFWEPAKFVAKLRNMKTDNRLLLLKTEMGAGHFGPSGRYDAWKETAFEYAFLLKTLW